MNVLTVFIDIAFYLGSSINHSCSNRRMKKDLIIWPKQNCTKVCDCSKTCYKTCSEMDSKTVSLAPFDVNFYW